MTIPFHCCIYNYEITVIHENVVILTKFSSLAALEVVILTTFSAASDENFIKMKTFPFQCMAAHAHRNEAQISFHNFIGRKLETTRTNIQYHNMMRLQNQTIIDSCLFNRLFGLKFQITGRWCGGNHPGDRWIQLAKRHQSSASMAIVRRINCWPVDSPHKGQWHRALMFSLIICAWINGWVNNREAGDSRRHRAHYDVIVMYTRQAIWIWQYRYK